MDLYIFCVVLGAAGIAAMALLGFASSHSGGGHAGHGGRDTSGHELHGAGGHTHALTPPHAIPHAHAPAHAAGAQAAHAHIHSDGWKSQAWSWLSPRVMFNFLVGFGASGLVIERLVGPILALPV